MYSYDRLATVLIELNRKWWFSYSSPDFWKIPCIQIIMLIHEI